MIRHLLIVSCAVASLLVFVPGPVEAAGADAPATVTGTVQGPDGARLPGVLISVLNGEGIVVSQVVSGDQGAYRVSRLRAGRYRLRAELSGFRPTVTDEIRADGRDVIEVNLDLDLESLSEVVTVVGSADRESLETPRIRESNARDVGEALGALAGVWKVRRGAIASDVVVRGYQGDNVTVLIDGARLYGACPNNMDHTAFHVDFAEVDRIEIGKGPFDLKNQGGLGGAVNIVTRRPAEGVHLNAQMSAGSSGYINPSVTASFGTRRIAVLGGYSYRIANAYRDGEGRSFLEGTNYRSSAMDGRVFDVNTAWSRIDVSPSAAHGFQVAYTRQRAGTVLYPYLQMDAGYDNADRVNLGYDWKRAIGPIQSVHARGYVTRVSHWMTDESRTSSVGMARPYSMATMARTDTQGGKVEATIAAGTVGLEIYRRGWDTATQLAMTKFAPQFSIPDVTLTSVGLFGEFSRELGRALRLDFGGRLDRTRNAADPAKANGPLYRAYHGAASTSAVDTYPSGKVRLSYKVASALTLSGGVGRTVRVPDPQERYFGLRRMGTDWVGNPFLRPTTNTGLEVSLAYRAGRLFVNGSLHRDALHDAIGVYQQPRMLGVAGIMNASARSYRNLDATMSGAELEALYSVTDRLFVSGDVSAVRGRQRANAAAGIAAGWLAEMPPTRSRLALRYERRGARRSVFTEVETVYSLAQHRVDLDLRESPTPAYAVSNARIGGSVGRVRVALGIANLFNRTYVEHLSYQRDPFRSGAKVYEPGRNIYTNVAVVF